MPKPEPDPLFETPDPVDPFRVAEPPPAEPPTIEPPELPPIDPDTLPPLPAQPPPTPPPGHAELTTAGTSLTKVLPKFDPEQKDYSLEKTAARALLSRSNLADYWTGQQGIVLAALNESMRLETDQDKVAEFNRIKNALGTDGELTKALADWCAHRNPKVGESPDLKLLATIADTIASEASKLAYLLPRRNPDGTLNEAIAGELAKAVMTQEAILMGVVQEIIRENGEVLKGQPVDVGNPSDAVVQLLSGVTRDGKAATNLGSKNTYKEVGTILQGKFDAASARSPVSIGPDGKPINVDLGPLKDRLSELDSKVTKRDELTKQLEQFEDLLAAATNPADKAKFTSIVDNYRQYRSQAVNDVVQAYLRAGRELQSNADALKRRAQELADPKTAKKKGWDKATLGTLSDLTFAAVRTMRETLASDPATRDPDYGGVARKVVKDLDGISGPTRLEAIASANASNPRQYWKKTKADELANLKKGKIKTTDLKNQFGKKLEDQLDAWAGQVKKFPRHDPEVSRQLVLQISSMLQDYRAAVRTAAPDDIRLTVGLMEGIDVVGTMISLQLKKFDQRGGMFS